MGKVIKVTEDTELSAIDCPEGVNYRFLQEQIGGHIKHVHPVRLYELLKKRNLPAHYCMLVDEEGLLKRLPFNPVGSYLYQTDKHGSPIVGTILIVAETEEDFAPIPESEFSEMIMLMTLLTKSLEMWR